MKNFFFLHHWPSASSVNQSWNFSWGCHPGSSESFVSLRRSRHHLVPLPRLFHLQLQHLQPLQLHLPPRHPVWWSAKCGCADVQLGRRSPGSTRLDLPHHRGDTEDVKRPGAAAFPRRPGSDHLSKIRAPARESKTVCISDTYISWLDHIFSRKRKYQAQLELCSNTAFVILLKMNTPQPHLVIHSCRRTRESTATTTSFM